MYKYEIFAASQTLHFLFKLTNQLVAIKFWHSWQMATVDKAF